MDFIFRLAEEFLKKHKRLNRYRRVFAVIAAVVVFATTYELILPAITMDKRRAADTPGVEVGLAADSFEEEAVDSGSFEEESSDADAGESLEAEPADTSNDTNSENGSDSTADTDASSGHSTGSGSSDTDISNSEGNSENTSLEADSFDDADGNAESTENADAADTADSSQGTGTDGQTTETTDSGITSETVDGTDTALTTDPSLILPGETITTYPATLVFEGKDYTITATFDETAGLPADARLDAVEILPDVIYKDENGNPLYSTYEEYYEKAVKAVEKEKKLEEQGQTVTTARFFDITFLDNTGLPVEPKAPVSIAVKYKDALSAVDTADTMAVHFDVDEKKTTVEEPAVKVTDVIDTKTDVKKEEIQEISFDAEKFSVYGVIGTQVIEATYLTADGDTYKITVNYGPGAGIPEGATLEVHEIVNGDDQYSGYVEQAAKALANSEEVPFVNAARLFDISIMADGKKVEPKEPVEVKIEYTNAESLNETSEVGAVHFKESPLNRDTEVLDINVQGEEGKVDGVSFTTDSFSIYAVVIIDKEAGTFAVEDENYKVTITYTKEANIPIGTQLTVKEITPEEDQYWELRKNTVEKINEGVKWEDTELTPDPRKGITDAVFFDISLVNDGTEIEPDVPLQVRIEYKNGGVLVPENESTQIIHFAKDKTETIEDVDVQYSEGSEAGSKVAIAYEYEQASFSVVGSYSTGEYIEINESNIIKPSAGIKAVPILRAAGDSSITASKNLTDEDNDGVYDLTLSVTGQSESSSSTTVNKSNVVVVVDVSGSMDEKTYTKYTGAGTSTGNYYGINNNGSYVKLEWRYSDGRNRWQYKSGGRYYNYNGEVYYQESRLEATKRTLKELVGALLANNKDEVKDGVNLNDIIEITLIKFADPVENLYRGWNGTSTLIRNVNTEAEKNQLNTTIDNLWAGGGTNWERALALAKTEADAYKSSQADEDVSIIFVTDGVPTMWGTDPNNGGSESIDNTHKAWNEADDDARAIVSAGYTLYDIFSFGTDTQKYDWDGGRTDADYLRSLTNYAYSGSGTYANTTLSTAAKPYFFNAKDTSALQDAFNAIIKSISGNVGYGGVTVDDGVTTGVTRTSVTVDGTINPEKFQYKIKSGDTTLATVHINSGDTATFNIGGTDYTSNAETVTTVINGTPHTNKVYSVTVGDKTYKMSPASMDDKGKIQWDLAGIGIIENGYTYELSLEVWPDQLSYDMVADLNNGVKTKEQLKQEIIAAKGQEAWDQIDRAFVGPDANGRYSIRTNYEQYVDYYTVETETDQSTGETTTNYTEQPRKELGEKEPIELESSKMDFKKIWDDSMDESQLEQLQWNHDDDGNRTTSKEYRVKLHVWKAETLEELDSILTQYSEQGADGQYTQADNHDYTDKTLGWDDTKQAYSWENKLDVAPGTMVDLDKAREMGITIHEDKIKTFEGNQYYILEAGHYYTVTEEYIDDHFELNTIIYHPMLVNGVLNNVTFKADGTIERIDPMSSVDANNTLRGGINITKTVKDEAGNILTYDGAFEASIELTPPTEPKRIEDYWIDKDHTQSKGKVAWYRYYDENDDPISDQALIEAGILQPSQSDKTKGEGANYDGDDWFCLWFQDYTTEGDNLENIHPASGTILISPKYTLRFTNMANGIGYTVVETDSKGMVASVTGGEGTVRGNQESNVSVVNTTPVAKVKLHKNAEGNTSKSLKDACFLLYKDAECTQQIKTNATGGTIGVSRTIDEVAYTNVLVSDENGMIEIGTLVIGDYYLLEVKAPDGYNKLTEAVKLSVEDNPSGEGSRVTILQYSQLHTYNEGDDGFFTAEVQNTAGAVLPHTGGPGTLLYTLGGFALIGASALMYVFRMRRRERRVR